MSHKMRSDDFGNSGIPMTVPREHFGRIATKKLSRFDAVGPMLHEPAGETTSIPFGTDVRASSDDDVEI